MRVPSRKLFLDDVRQPYDSSWDVARSYAEFAAYVSEHGVPEVISFDHDLADEHYLALDAESFVEASVAFTEKTGCACAWLLITLGQFPRLAIVHTFNPAGAHHLMKLLAPYCKVVRAPYDE